MIPQMPQIGMMHSGNLLNKTSDNSDTTTSVTTTTTTATTGDNSAPAGKNPSSWDPEDDLLLRHLKEVKSLGWKDIAQYFDNRTPNACQFRWRRLKSGNLKANKTALVDVSDYTSVIAALHDGKLNEYRTVPFVPEVPSPGKSNGLAKTIAPVVKVQNAPPAMSAQTVASVVQPQTTHPVHSTVSPLGPSPSKETYANKFIASGNLALSHGPGPAIVTESPSLHPHPSGKRFVKPRSFSHSVTRPKIPPGRHMTTPENAENLGFIPKIIVRSRRNSLVGGGVGGGVTPVASAHGSRKNSLSVTALGSRNNSLSLAGLGQRRSSFNVGVTGGHFPFHGGQDIHLGRNTPEHSFPATYGFVDSPGTPHQPSRAPWTPQEDELLREGVGRNLSCKEVAVLLDNRTETDARLRLAWLQGETGQAPRENIDPLQRHAAHLPSLNNILNDAAQMQ